MTTETPTHQGARMTTDRELLEAAAKAAGMEGWRYASPYMGMVKMIDPTRPNETGSIGPDWNPLLDDGDAFRLAVALRLDVLHNNPQDNDAWVMAGCHMDHTVDVDGEGSRAAATRRAIVRAAASMVPA